MRRYTAVPHPFVIIPDSGKTIDADECFSLGFTLFGRANDYLPYIIHAFTAGGERGIGRGNGRYEVETVCQETTCGADEWNEIYRPGSSLDAQPPTSLATPGAKSQIIIKLITPLRVKRDERLVNADRFMFHDMFIPLVRRISMLMYFHGDTELDVDFTSLTQAARKVRIKDKRVKWKDWTRYSSRQGTTMKMGGLIGELSLDGKDIEPFWPYLWFGQWSHAGKGATMGLGRYAIEPASLPDQTKHRT